MVLAPSGEFRPDLSENLVPGGKTSLAAEDAAHLCPCQANFRKSLLDGLAARKKVGAEILN
jgi:hypothetical protein